MGGVLFSVESLESSWSWGMDEVLLLLSTGVLWELSSSESSSLSEIGVDAEELVPISWS